MTSLSRRAWIAGSGAACLAGMGKIHAAEPTQWIDQRQLGPFAIRASYPLRDDAAIVATLEPLERELQRVLGLTQCRSPISIHILANRWQHRQYLREQFPQVPYRRALFVKSGGSASVYAYRSDELGIDLRHEATHALLHADLPMVPLWLDEGIAEYFEQPRASRALQSPHLDDLTWNVRTGNITSIEKLQQKHRLEDLGAIDYRHAWAWVHFLLHGPVAGHAVLVRFLSQIRQHVPPGDFATQLRTAIPQLDAELLAHFRHWRSVARKRG